MSTARQSFGHRRRVAALLAGTCVLVIVLLGSALGAGGLSYVSKHKNVVSGEPGRTYLSVACPGGRHVTSGGVEVTGDESNLDLEVGSTLPTKNNTAWRGGANDNPPTPDANMTVTAICSRGKFFYETAKKQVKIGGFSRKIVSCPAGTEVIGGGAGAPGDHGVEVIQSEPRDGKDADTDPNDAWLGGESNSSSKVVTLKVVAICSKLKNVKRVTGKPKTVAIDTQNSAKVSCPGGSHVIGGGSHTKPHSTNSEVADSFPIDGPDADSKPDDGWEVDANNDGGSAPIKLRSIAFCSG